MTQLLIDTNVYVAFKRNDANVVNLLNRAAAIAINIVVLGELLAGFRGGRREAENLRELDLFLDSPRVTLLPLDEGTASFFALVFNQLKSQGTPIPANDIWIGASAMQHGLALASLDNHFDKIGGLNISPGLREVRI
jgi:predicted nucleic acid-binding protein